LFFNLGLSQLFVCLFPARVNEPEKKAQVLWENSPNPPTTQSNPPVAHWPSSSGRGCSIFDSTKTKNQLVNPLKNKVMKTVSTFAVKTRVFAATALMGVAILFQPAETLAQKAGKAPASAHGASSFTTTASPQLMASFYETEPMKLRLHLANPAGGSVTLPSATGKTK
jgi:hypothetical protein